MNFKARNVSLGDPETVATRIFVLHTTIKIGYKSVIHCRALKRSVQFIKMNNKGV